MEFGRIPHEELKASKLKLPADAPQNAKLLKGKRHAKASVFLGCAKWGRPEWVGTLYPEKTKEKEFLSHYVMHYNSIELNATHYKLYGEKATEKWSHVAGDRPFIFCPKLYKGISHFGNLATKQFLTSEFLRGIKGFGSHLGPVFIQMSDRFSPKRKEELYGFLAGLPRDQQFFLEVRHEGWFADKSLLDELFAHLNKYKIGAVITDAAGRRDCLHMRLTVRKAFIRFVGNSLHKTDYQRCNDWAERIRDWLSGGLKEIYFFMHMHDEAKSPELTEYMVKKLNKTAGTALPVPAIRKVKSPATGSVSVKKTKK